MKQVKKGKHGHREVGERKRKNKKGRSFWLHELRLDVDACWAGGAKGEFNGSQSKSIALCESSNPTREEWREGHWHIDLLRHCTEICLGRTHWVAGAIPQAV